MPKRIPTHIAEKILASEGDASEVLIGSNLAYKARKPTSAVLFNDSMLLVFRCSNGCLGVVARRAYNARIMIQIGQVQEVAGYPDEQFTIGDDMFAVWYSRKPTIDFERIASSLFWE